MLNGARAMAAWPASPQPHGMLLSDDSRSSRRAMQHWAVAEQRLAAASAAVGLALCTLSLTYLYALTQAGGVILGLVLTASGAAGYVGGSRRSLAFTNLHLVAAIVAVLLAFGLIGNVTRDTQLDCALAELYHRGAATEALVRSVQQQEAMQAVYARLNEMEDHLSLVQQGTLKQVELRQEQERMRDTDLTYIRAKVEMLKAHAQELLDSVLKHPDLTVNKINRMSEEDKEVLRRRMQTADKVLERITKHHESVGGQISYEEYQELLAALTDASTVQEEIATRAELRQAQQELPNAKAALERSAANIYHNLQVGTAPQQLAQLSNLRRERREQFNCEFERHLAQQNERGADYVLDLPAHCLSETAGERLLVGAGIVAILLQLASAYTALSLSFRLPTKSA